MVDLSIPVIWVEDGGPLLAGRLDLSTVGLHLDGGSRDARRTRDLPFGEISSFRFGRDRDDRIGGRTAIVLELTDGGRVSFVGFDRPGVAHELAERLEQAGVTV